MSQATINIIKAQLAKVEEEMPRLRSLVGVFEQRLTAITKKLPPFVTSDDPRFERPLADLQSCRDLIEDTKKSIKKHAVKIAKYQSAVKSAEQALAAEQS